MYSTSIECFNKMVRCDFCNKALNKSYLRSHIKKQHVQRHVQYAPPRHLQTSSHSYAQRYPQSYPQGHGQSHAQGFSQSYPESHGQSYAQGFSQSYTQNHGQSYAQGFPQSYAQSYAQDYINIKDSFKCATNDIAGAIANPNDDDNNVLQHYSTLIVVPSFCGKTHLLSNKLQLIRLSDSEKQIHIFTRSPEQNKDVGMKPDVGDLVVEEDLGDKSIQDFQNCCIVFDDMLDSNQKLIDPFFTRGRHNLCDFYYLSQSYFEVPKRTIRNNSNIIILFQQTLKDIEHIYRDIAGFDMSYDEFKELCREAWKQKIQLLINK